MEILGEQVAKECIYLYLSVEEEHKRIAITNILIRTSLGGILMLGLSPSWGSVESEINFIIIPTPQILHLITIKTITSKLQVCGDGNPSK